MRDGEGRPGSPRPPIPVERLNPGPAPERRRQPPGPLRHSLGVHLNDQHMLEVRCTCGIIVGGRRFSDRTMVSLADLLELVRIHSGEWR